jgi:hypothetical protein
MRHRFDVFILGAWLLTGGIIGADCLDSDRDGLPNYQETHKYFTNPATDDSDADGIKDGDWHERREHTYSIRTVVKVMRPCDAVAANDDYQDARVLSETEDFVELEVVHYPFNTNAAAIEGTREWKNHAPELKQYLKAGVTTNWDESMRREMLTELQASGLDLDALNDKQVVEQVADWLLKRGKYRYMFGTYFVHFPNDQAEIFPGLDEAFRREQGNTNLPFIEHLQHEVFGKGMFSNKCYGTCTSTAVYLTTALRAIEIPTRMILAIPVVDGCDARQVGMVEQYITHHQVRRTLLSNLPSAGFVAHTFNEVYVGGRWRRLNYRQLGQNNYGPGAMGMLTHVLTFRDLSDAGLTKTWGKRYGLGERDDTFSGSNPYRATEISDRFGIHSKLQNPPIVVPKLAVISKAYWFFSELRPSWIPAESVQPKSDGHLLVHVSLSMDDLKAIYPKLSPEFVLVAEGKPSVRARAERGFWNEECYVRIPEDQFALMEPGVVYEFMPAKTDREHQWKVEGEIKIVKPK